MLLLARLPIFLLALWVGAQAQAQIASNRTGDPSNGSASVAEMPNDCVTAAAAYHGVNPWILRAILKVESNFNANAVNRNANGTSDIGIAQINSTHFAELARYGIAPRDLMDACVGGYVAAWHLKRKIVAYGNTWYAIGAYHSITPCQNQRYSSLVWNALLDWHAVVGAKRKVPLLSACTGQTVAQANNAEKNRQSILALDLE